MATIVQMSRLLEQRPETTRPQGMTLRHFAGPEDVELWLELRRRAFARERFGVRDWTAEDFAREFLSKPWWSAERMWFAVPQEPTPAGLSAVGTVALAGRESAAGTRFAVHWLAVLPSHRRRGVGRMLLGAVEQACWDAGQRQVWLETHAAWKGAMRLYEAAGYRVVD